MHNRTDPKPLEELMSKTQARTKSRPFFIVFTLIALAIARYVSAQPALPPPPPPTLNAFWFDTTNWVAGRGVQPITNTALTLVTSFDSNAVKFASAPARLEYPCLATNGFTNITVNRGCLHFWFKPGFGSTNAGGQGLGAFGRLIELGEWTANASIGFFSLYLDPPGTHIYFSTQTNGNGGDYITAPIAWASNTWHYIGLNYTATNTQLYLDGAFVTNGPGVTYYPGPEIRTNSFRIGSDKYGTNVAKGIFENLRTYSGPFSVEYFDSFYESGLAKMDNNGYGQNNSAMYGGGGDDGGWQLDGAEDGGGDLGVDGLYLLPPVISGTNMIISIAGADTNELYDLYFSTNLINWSWLSRSQPMQTNFYLTQWPTPAGFFQLGTLLDSDGDSIPDAFEVLITMTDPAVVNTAASLGVYSNLLITLPTQIRITQITDRLILDDLWGPCDDGVWYDPIHERYFFNWNVALGGTNNYQGWGYSCDGMSDWSVVTTNSFPPSDRYPLRLDWHGFDTNGSNMITEGTRFASTSIELDTGGLFLSSTTWPWLLSVSAISQVASFSTDGWYAGAGTNILPTDIRICSGEVNQYGEIAFGFRDNSVNDITPSVVNQSNFTFVVSAQKVKVGLDFHSAGALASREITNLSGQLIGYAASNYDLVTNLTGTTSLGAGNPPHSNLWFNFQDTRAIVPTNLPFRSGWAWHRDVSAEVFLWRPAAPSVLNTNRAKVFSSATPGGPGGNDDGGVAPDNIPDANGLIVTADGPGMGEVTLTNVFLPGSVSAMRFYAREWVTWSGVQACDIIRWRSFVTLRRKSNWSWERKGPNFIEITPSSDPEVPTFTAADATNIFNLP